MEEAILYGNGAIIWLGSLLVIAIGKYVIDKIDNQKVRKYVGRAFVEVKSAVAEVYQTYVGALKEADADGKLTDEEKAEAKSRAVAMAKSNIGKKGLKRLTNVLGVDAFDDWLGNKVEAAVDHAKKVGKAVNGGKAGKLLVGEVDETNPLP